MGWTAAIGPALSLARTLGGGMARNAAAGNIGVSSPFDNVFNPEIQSQEMGLPERNPRFKEQAELQSVFDETPGLMASALLGGDPEGAMLDAGPGREVLPVDGPPPQRIDMAELAKKQNAPVRIDLSSMPRPKSNEQLMAEQGYTVNSVQGQPMANVFDAAPSGGMTDIARTAPNSDRLPQADAQTDIPRSAFDDDIPAPTSASAFEPQFDTNAPEAESSVFGDIGNGVNYVQDWLEGSPENPLFQTGMALMASGYDGSNPFTGMQSGLNAIPQLAMQRQKGELERRKGEAEMADAANQKQLQEALAMIAAMYGETPSGDGPSSQRSKGQAYVVR